MKSIAWIVVVLSTMSACTTGETVLSNREKIYSTESANRASFHRVVEGDEGLALRFPGYLIGVEKSPRDAIGVGSSAPESDSVFPLTLADFDRPRPDVGPASKLSEAQWSCENEEAWRRARRFYDDSKRMFVSHVVEYALSTDAQFPRISTNFLHDAYAPEFHPRDAYSKGRSALTKLRASMTETVTQGRHTHIVLVAMGWNTDQQETIRNVNSLIGQLVNSAPDARQFRPLVVAVSWPSKWEWFSVVSYPNKANDADEIGLTWARALLRDVLIPVKRSARIPLVVLGHSFGARLVTRAVAGVPSDHTWREQDDVDLVVALQGAFSANRFFSGNEGVPYAHFARHAKRVVCTWSQHDSANPVASCIGLAPHVGGTPGHKKARTAPSLFDFAQVTTRAVDDLRDDNFAGVETDDPLRPFEVALDDSARVLMVDASSVISLDVHGKGGGAHSDVFRPGVASLIWHCLQQL